MNNTDALFSIVKKIKKILFNVKFLLTKSTTSTSIYSVDGKNKKHSIANDINSIYSVPNDVHLS